MEHFTTPKYWEHYNKLPRFAQEVADKNFGILKTNPYHPSLHLKKVARFWSVRAGLNYRALGVTAPNGDDIIWVWIGTHAQYDKLIAKK